LQALCIKAASNADQGGQLAGYGGRPPLRDRDSRAPRGPISEGARDENAESLWVIDPIDGTKAFVRGYSMFATQIALLHAPRS
jgi:3'-phosphoadenosine 5'-phosphosulfate (PAPS) 3'-phosphatase